MSKQNSIAKENPKQAATEEQRFVEDIKQIVATAKIQAYKAVNLMQVASNWLLGWRIVEQMQHGQERAEYGAYVIKLASAALTKEFGAGYSVQSLKFYRQFYLTFKDLQIGSTAWSQSQDEKGSTVWSESSVIISQTPAQLLVKIGQTLPAQLTWSHFKRLMRVDDEKARMWYMHEAASQQWSYRTLDRNINSQYYYRLLQTPDDLKHEVVDEMKSLTSDYQKDKYAFMKNPVVAEFLGLPQNIALSETKLETAIIDHLQKFIMELGKGYAFVARQQLIRTDLKDYYIDLVFYNYILKCFLLIDLKTTEITHQDIGQMDMYIRMYDELKCSEGDNPTIGLLLCAETSKDLARYSILKDNQQLFAAKYLTYLPDKEQLLLEIERQKEIFAMQEKNRNDEE
jgi:predicted nuclease of restriction endonuclease-like (RecB) superfamily